MESRSLDSVESLRREGHSAGPGIGAGPSTPERLIVVSEGGPDDVEDALVRIAKALDFEVIVVSPDPQLTEPPDRLVLAAKPDLTELSLTGRDSVVLLTHGDRDVEILRSLAGTPLRFVGLWSDGERAERNRAELGAQGVSPEFLARLHAPVAGDSRLRAPSEIALAILSEVVEGNGPTKRRPAARPVRRPRARRRA